MGNEATYPRNQRSRGLGKIPGVSPKNPDLGTQERVLTESRAEQKLERPRMWRVLLHNDDYTTQDFVVWVLETVFHKPRGEAFTVMLSVHQTGLGVAGIYTHDVAETKLKATRNLAEQHEFPLLVTMEPEAVTN
jgi:ATP-dependent Clp protease adaptor protein ClpS